MIQQVEVERAKSADLTSVELELGVAAALADVDRGHVYDRDVRALTLQLQQVLWSLERRSW